MTGFGARTNRYGDFLDIACALVGRAPDYGLHRAENRRATVVVDASGLSPALRNADVFYPVLGTWLGLVLNRITRFRNLVRTVAITPFMLSWMFAAVV